MAAPRGAESSFDGPFGTTSGLSTGTPTGMPAGRYELGERLGLGGAADVMRATDVSLGREVAVKIFRPGGDPTLEAGFEAEAALLARLQHPGLVTVYDAGVHEGRPYLVMELVDGQTLRHRIGEEPLAVQAVQRLGKRLAYALAHVHGAGIVHRDVKPSNILLDGEGRPHLTDFGIARLVDATTRTHSGAFTGTAAYMSPEQVRGDRPGPAADIYALGLVLLECLTGELEYDGTPLESAVARLHRAPAIPEDVPADLRKLLAAMTRTEPEERPDATTCAEWLAAGLTASRTTGALPPKLPPARRHRALTIRTPLVVLAALVGLIGAVGVGMALTASQADPPGPSEQAPVTAVQPDASASTDGETAKSSPTPRTSEPVSSPTAAAPEPAQDARQQSKPKRKPPKENKQHPERNRPGPPADKDRGGPPDHAGKPPHAGR